MADQTPLRLTFSAGSRIRDCFVEALQIAESTRRAVAFDFNEQTETVQPGDSVDQLMAARDERLERRRQAYLASPEHAEVQARDEIARQTKAARDAEIDTELAGQELAFTQGGAEKWAVCTRINDDPYGSCIVRFAERWARLMQARLGEDAAVASLAMQASFDANNEGITGFMYGAAVSILAEAWVHGEALREWHNAEYGHAGDGVVNPAVLTVGSA